jgi:SAM-dependent methyltransferase
VALRAARAGVFAADHAALARELGRVCRPGGRLGLTHWLPDPELRRLMDRLGYERPAEADRPGDWGRLDYAANLLGHAFELELHEASAPGPASRARPSGS